MKPEISGNGRSLPEAQSGPWQGAELDGESVSCHSENQKLECAAEPAGDCSARENTATSEQAVRGLVEAFEASSRASLVSPLATAAGNSNAERTSERTAGGYLELGMTRSGDSFAGVAALKGRDADTGLEVEVFTASAQVGRQTELQAGLARVGVATSGEGLHARVTFEALTARASAGTHNDDGSKGANLGAMATGAGAEATLEYSGWSATLGLSASLGAAASSGERDIDGDGVREGCFEASVGPLTLGFCTEFE
jgi:hypothetical protein